MCSKPNVNKRRGSGGNIVKEKLQRKKDLDELGFFKKQSKVGASLHARDPCSSLLSFMRGGVAMCQSSDNVNMSAWILYPTTKTRVKAEI